MIDGIDGRMWAEHGHAFSESVARALSQAMTAFQRLNAIQFDAPWRENTGRSGHPGRHA
jgi:hypothetical protein